MWFILVSMERNAAAPSLCYRHPTVEARRRCYHCSRPICPACQLRTGGHIFCSEECSKGHKRSAFFKRLAKYNRTALAGHWFRAALFAAILAAGAAAVWFSMNADRFLEGPELSLPTFKKPHEKGLDQEHVNWDQPGAIYIENPAPGSVLKVNKVSVSGRAPEEAMVGLYINGQKVDVQMARTGQWRFEGVPLTGSRNILQARFFDNRGNSAYSPAVWVDLEARPAAFAASAAAPAIPEPTPDVFNVTGASEGSREILLTFDGGSNANATPAILDILKSRKVRASLFLTGEYMQRYPDLVRRMAAEGHVIGNHTFSHPHLTTMSFNGRQNTLSGVTEEFLRLQLSRPRDLFKLITGRDMDPYWRAPFGEFNKQILKWAKDAGYTHVYWTPHLDTLDWVSSPADPLFKTPQQILAGLLARESKRGGVDGGIVLMHLGSDRDNEMRADTILGQLIDSLSARSYRFSTVEDVPRPPGNGNRASREAPPPSNLSK